MLHNEAYICILYIQRLALLLSIIGISNRIGTFATFTLSRIFHPFRNIGYFNYAGWLLRMRNSISVAFLNLYRCVSTPTFPGQYDYIVKLMG